MSSGSSECHLMGEIKLIDSSSLADRRSKGTSTELLTVQICRRLIHPLNSFDLKPIITCLVVCATQRCVWVCVKGRGKGCQVNSRGRLSVCEGGKSWQLRTRLINAKRKHAYKLCALRREFISMNAANKLRVLTLIIRPVCGSSSSSSTRWRLCNADDGDDDFGALAASLIRKLMNFAT